MTDARRLGVAATAALLLAQAPLSSHSGITAYVTMTPGRPVAGQACQVSVVAIGPAGALSAPGQRLRLIGEMSGHPMPPVRVDFQPAFAKGRYDGELVVTMAGPWSMTLEVDYLGEPMWAAFVVDANADADAPAAPGRYTLQMLDPVRTTLFPPVWVVLTAVGLTAAAEGTAVAVRRRRRAFRTTGA